VYPPVVDEHDAGRCFSVRFNPQGWFQVELKVLMSAARLAPQDRGIMPILTGCSSADRLKSAWGDRLPVEGGPSEGPIRASMGSWMSDSKGPRAAGGCSVERRASGPVAPVRLIAAGVAELRQHGDRDGSSNR